jgi:Pentapeptide repeats (8 copies)
VRLALTAVLASVVRAGCGGSGTPEAVGDCTIAPGTQCPGADLSDANLEGVDLSGADLSSAILTETDLSGANLTEVNLRDSRITDSNLSEADLTRANLTGATITDTNLDGAILCGTTRTDGTTDDSSCPATEDTTETETTTAPPTEAEVTTFEVGDLSCDGAASAAVTVSWETENATAVRIALDTAAPMGYGPSGSTDVTVPCDEEPHAITITPQSDTGPGAPETEEVTS